METLRKYVAAYQEAVYSRAYERLRDFYHSKAIFVDATDGSEHLGANDIAKQIADNREALVPCVTTVRNERCYGKGTVLCRKCTWELISREKTLRGTHFQVFLIKILLLHSLIRSIFVLQVWKKESESFVIVYDEIFTTEDIANQPQYNMTRTNETSPELLKEREVKSQIKLITCLIF